MSVQRKQSRYHKPVTKASAKHLSSKHQETDLSDASASPHRERILQKALDLLSKGGRDAVTTRAVAEAAGVQPPVLYRLFGDKRGLLDAVTAYGFTLYLAEKRTPHAVEDPVQFLRDGWAKHIDFGLAHPELYLLMYADPRTGSDLHARHGYPGLRAHMHTVAAAGRLRVSADRAAALFHAAACGIVLTLLAQPAQTRDMALSNLACEGALATILTDQPLSPAPTTTAAANMLRAHLLHPAANPQSADPLFSEAETALLLEWLTRLGKAPQ